MAIPTLQGYTDYTFNASVEHPFCYIGMYFRTSDGSDWRLSTFDKDTLAELDTLETAYIVPGDDPVPNGHVSPYDDILWTFHANVGVESWNISAVGSITQIVNYSEGHAGGGGGYIVDICETPTDLWLSHRTENVQVHAKEGNGVLTAGGGDQLTEGSAVFLFTDTHNEWLFIGYEPISGHVIITSDVPHDVFSFDGALYTETDSIASPGASPYFIYTDDSRSAITPHINNDRNGHHRSHDIDTDGTILDLENMNAANNPYNVLVAQHVDDVWAWYHMDDGYDGIKWSSSADHTRDLTLYGVHTVEDPIFNTHSIDNTTDGSLYCDDHTAYGEIDDYSWTGTNDDWSVSAWIKPESYDNYQSIIEVSSATAPAIELIVSKTTGRIQFGIYDGSWHRIDGPALCLVDPYYHIVITYSSSTGMKLYVNGVLHGTNSHTGGHDSGNTHTRIGRSTYHDLNTAPTGEHRLHGYMQEVLILTKTLPIADIVELFIEGSNDRYAGTYRERILSLNPSVYLPCDDHNVEISDISGNGNHLTGNGDVTYNQAGLASGGHSVHIDGTAGSNFDGTSNVVISDGASEITTECWVNRDIDDDDTVSSGYDLIFRVYTDNSDYIQLSYEYSKGALFTNIRIQGVTSDRAYIWNDMPRGRWAHLVTSFSSSNSRLRLYMNGTLMIETTVSGTTLDGDVRFVIGNTTLGGTEYPTKGYFQHAAVYATELTPAQIADNYELGSGYTPVASNAYEALVISDAPFVYFPLDEITGGTVADKMGRVEGVIIGGSANTMSSTGINLSTPTQTCLEFDGATQWIRLNDGQTLGSWGAFTVEAIVTSNIVDASRRDIIGTAQSGGYTLIMEADGHFEAQAHHSGSGAWETPDALDITTINDTYHVALTFDGRYVHIHVNGVLLNTEDAGSIGNIDYTVFLRGSIGGQWGGSLVTDTIDKFWDGKIAHVAFYNTALTQTQLRKHAALAKGYNLLTPDDYQTAVIDNDPVFFLPFEKSNFAYTLDTGWSSEYFPDLPYTENISFTDDTLMPSGNGSMIGGNSGVDAYLLSTGVLPDVVIEGSMSWEFWCNLSGVDSSGRLMIGMGAPGESLSTNVMTLSIYDTGVCTFFWEHGAGSNSSHTSPSGVFTFNKLQHFVVRVDNITKKVAYYINSIKVYEDSFTTSMEVSGYTGRFAIGYSTAASSSNNIYGLYGSFQNFAIYDSAIPVSVITEHYAIGVGTDLTLSDDYSTNVMEHTPSAYYRLGEQIGTEIISDSSGNSHNMVPTDVTFEQDGSIIDSDNTAAYFTGITSSSYTPDIIIGDTPSHLTVEFWGKLGVDDTGCSITRGKIATGEPWNIIIEIIPTGVQVYLKTVDPSTTTRYFHWVGKVDLDEWHHLVFTWTEGVNGVGYFDGRRIYDIADTTSQLLDSVIGWRFGAHTTTFNSGTMDEVSIYDSVLPKDDVLEHYFSGINKFDGYTHTIMIPDEYGQPNVMYTFDTDDNITCYDYLGVNNGVYEGSIIVGDTPLHKESTHSLICDGTTGKCILIDDIDSPTWNSNQIAIEIWAQTTTKTGERVLFQDGGATDGYQIGFYDDEFGIWIRQDGTTTACTIGAERIPLNITFHVVVQIVEASIKLFINGTQYTTTTGTFNDFDGADGTCIGAHSSGSCATGAAGVLTHAWSGLIDSVILYGDTLFDEARADVHYMAGFNGTNYELVRSQLLPVLYFNFDESSIGSIVTDEISGTILDVNPDAGSTYTIESFANGIINRGLSLYGDGSYISSADAGRHTVTTENADVAHINKIIDYSVSFWVNLDKTDIAFENVVYYFGNTGDHGLSIHCAYDETINTWTIKLISDKGGNTVSIESVETFPSEEWHHIIVTVSATGGTVTYNTYVDNVALTWDAGNTKADNMSVTGDETYNIGGEYHADDDDTYYHMRGNIDEFMHFNTSLSSDERTDLYNATATEYKVYGDVTQDGIPANRVVRVYRKSDGELVGAQNSTQGDFDIRWREINHDDEFYVVALDDNIDPELDPIARGFITPIEVT